MQGSWKLEAAPWHFLCIPEMLRHSCSTCWMYVFRKPKAIFCPGCFLYFAVFKAILPYILKQTMLARYSTSPSPTPFLLCDSRHYVTSALTRHW
jgi:hypothetical protein